MKRIVFALLAACSSKTAAPPPNVDCVAFADHLERLVKQSGGFGSFLVFAHDWADREATLRSYELFARSVVPHFQGSLAGPEASGEWVRGSGGRFVQAAANAIGQAMSDHEQERAARSSPA